MISRSMSMFDARIKGLAKGLILASVVFLGGCEFIMGKVFEIYLEPSPPDAPAGVVAHRDIVFSTTPEQKLYLDVYLPEDRGEQLLPVVLFLFGGGWEMGNRHQFIRYGLEDYPLEGFAVVTVDYRYLQEAIFPAQFQDVVSAIHWIRDSAKEYGFDVSRVGVIGPSAGGHLSALAGTVNRAGEFAGNEDVSRPSNVQAVVDYYGPTDFLQVDAHLALGEKLWSDPDSTVSRLLGAPIKTVPESVQMANPIAYIDGSEPPFLILHGEEDDVVPLQQSKILHQALVAAGVESEFVVVKGGAHGYGGDFFTEMPAQKVLAFFQRHLQGKDS
jgi:acetyl esterase/lipase